ncbi:Transcriptional regulator RPN4 [Fulvia fulva]|uniref:Transcriptional regulator RPN4 n=1 Tax=Passalora fulva TaxID=5499 RepID=A0A9Q8PIE5_PASFU|nr:Transcriptional regulator RPN4 [Fulvia fulva]KAK4626263.1 Transcriptional regulator RPN4 [Fulvia fulva]KAK4628309.1 Transcriptional regulator RPN4 [Fulvia fulva]UJO22984.1 Transcriptional regulator RPN4 [Fulvia fulva]WPV13513.1 Transcriptional regulator RPN4 [Fulvia fulva]WPV28153.1 Transcriptional regulator RPN4 [Fulvia fulva]
MTSPSRFPLPNAHLSQHHYSSLPPSPHTSTTTTTTTPQHDFALYEPAIYQQALTLLQQSSGPDSGYHHPTPNPDLTIHQPSPLRSYASVRQDSAISDHGVSAHDWQTSMYSAQVYNNSMNGSVTQQQPRGVKRSRSHQRTPSASTVASNGPASPHLYNPSYPQIANTETAPDQTSFYADQALFPKNLPTPSHTPVESGYSSVASLPSQAAHMSSAHYAMKGFGIDHHASEDYLSDAAPSRQSMSSYGNDSPATPQSGNGDGDSKQYTMQSNDYRQANPNVQLFRTESAAFQDELYNPNTVYTSAPSKPANSYLSPHRNLITERLQTANNARSASPASAVSRERSPFRNGSPLAPAEDWRPQNAIPTAQAMRQQQQQEAAQQEVQRATLRREPTKTISPKDAVLDYNDEQPSLFQDSIPEGYEKHFGGTEQWPTNNYLGQSTNFVDLSTTGQQNMSFRNATSADNGYSGTVFDFNGLPQGTDFNKNNPFQANYQAAVAAQMNQFSDQTPNFPASIPSMETSISDADLPMSSQETTDNGPTSVPQRPNDTRANTGTYTCTYHGCTQRFNSHNDLQKHKREYHRSQQQIMADSTSPEASESMSPRSVGTESPGPSTAGMTSAQILARNSQAGPHKCTRINPSTNKPCNTIFSRPYDLTRHEDTIHNGRKQKVRCPMCREEKTFSRNDALTRHMRVVHPEVESFGKRGRRD